MEERDTGTQGTNRDLAMTLDIAILEFHTRRDCDDSGKVQKALPVKPISKIYLL